MVKEDELFDIFHWDRHGDVAISMDQFSGPALRIMNFLSEEWKISLPLLLIPLFHVQVHFYSHISGCQHIKIRSGANYLYP